MLSLHSPELFPHLHWQATQNLMLRYLTAIRVAYAGCILNV